MWESFLAGAQYAGYAAGWIALVLLCFVGFFLAMIGISGMWMVVAAAVIGLFLTQSGRPTVLDVCVCAGISAAVDVTEWFAGMWGVRRRGGSRLAALMASLGGIGGALLGFLIPVPVIGNLLGMLIGSFLLAFLVEHRRLQRVGAATHIAFGATLACIAVVILKVCVTLGMALWLADVLWFAGS